MCFLFNILSEHHYCILHIRKLRLKRTQNVPKTIELEAIPTQVWLQSPSPKWWWLEPEAGEGNGTPLQYSCLENPMDAGAWWAAVHGVAKSQTWLSDFTFTFHFHALEKEWQPTPVFLPGESQGQGSLLGCHLWGRTESDRTDVT